MSADDRHHKQCEQNFGGGYGTVAWGMRWEAATQRAAGVELSYYLNLWCTTHRRARTLTELSRGRHNSSSPWRTPLRSRAHRAGASGWTWTCASPTAARRPARRRSSRLMELADGGDFERGHGTPPAPRAHPALSTSLRTPPCVLAPAVLRDLLITPGSTPTSTACRHACEAHPPAL